MEQITIQNWKHCGVKSGSLKAFIGIGAVPGNPPPLVYSVTLEDQDFREVYQYDFNNLKDALSCLNNKYGHWEFYDMSKNQSKEGCDSCQAH